MRTQEFTGVVQGGDDTFVVAGITVKWNYNAPTKTGSISQHIHSKPVSHVPVLSS